MSAPNNNDLLAIVDMAGAVTKKITRADLLKGTALPADTVTTPAITNGAVNSAKLAPTSFFLQPTGFNPVPTSLTDMPGSSFSVTPTVASYLIVTLSCVVRTVGGGDRESVTYLNVDGTNNASTIYVRTNVSGDMYTTASRTWRIALTAAAHTIKVQGIANAGAVAVVSGTTMWAQLFAQ